MVKSIHNFSSIDECNELPFLIFHQDPISPMPADSLFLNSDLFYLQALYGNESFSFRWEENNSFQTWNLINREKAESDVNWSVAVYIRHTNLDGCFAKVKTALSNQLNFVFCDEHKQHLHLIKRMTTHNCCKPGCSRLVSARCMANNCLVGVCQTHANDLENAKINSFVVGKMTLRHAVVENNNSQSFENHPDEDSVDENEGSGNILFDYLILNK